MTWLPAPTAELVGTLRFRVSAIASAVVLLVLTVVGVGLVLAQRAVLTDSLDEALAAQAEALGEQLQAGELPGSTTMSDDMLFLVVSPGGAIVAASPELAGVELGALPDSATTVVAAEVEGTSVRVLTTTSQGSTIHVVGNLEDVNESTSALVRSLTVGIPLSTVALGALLWWSVGRTLQPVEGIRQQVEQISASRLNQRVPEPDTHDEIARLAQTMNAMLVRLEVASERQQRFVADASHELRTPLARMRSELEVDLAYPDSADPAATSRSVLAETQVLQTLVDDLLLMARADSGALTLRFEPVDLDQLVDESVRAQRSITSLRIDTSAVEPVQAMVDSNQIQRVISNLLDNAVRHAAAVVTLRLSESAKGLAVLTVTDDGPGIPDARREEVFQRFSRLDEARDTSHGGAGLGLAIAREIAERHGGTLTVDSHEPGAQLRLTLPIGPGLVV